MLFLSLALLAAAMAAASSPCGNANLPPSPVFPTTNYPSGAPAQFTVTNHWSEVAQMHRPPAFTPIANEVQTNCPHKTGTFIHFSSLNLVANGNPITLPSNTRVLISTCSIPANAGGVFGIITIPSTSELVFNDDGPISIATKGIKVQGGKLLMGSETCRLRNKISITFYGTRQENGENKGIISVDGMVEMHGQRFTPTWTRLATTLPAGGTVLYVQDRVNWQVGMRLVVTTTELKDSRDYHENEERQITGVFKTPHANVTAITVSEPFAYQHFAGRAYQAEVALLTRTITLQGNAADSQPTDTANAVCTRTQDGGVSTFPCTNKYRTGFGFHVRIEGSNTQSARFSGVEWTRSGQTNMLGRYSLHYHMLGQNIAAGKLYAKDCSVHESYFRAYAIHGTNQVLLSENVAYDIVGHAYFLEDGVEEHNTLQYNIGALVHWLGDTTQTQSDSYESQYLFWLEESPSMILPSDSAASVFYITNAYNYFLGNAASGGWAGYGFVNLPKPVKLHQNYGNSQYRPKDRPLLLFKGNTAHSTGYWFGSAGGVYVGGQLEHNSQGVLVYTAGRSVDRDTCVQDPSLTWGYCPRSMHSYMVFQDTKVFLASRGMQHWGQRSEVIRAEAHDVGESMNVFGTVYLTQMLVQCRTFANTPKQLCAGNCAARDKAFFRSFSGFTWYDVYQNHIMTKTEFRNCNPQQVPCALQWKPECSGSAVFSMLTHSNQFVPEVMQASREITYTNYDPNTLVKFSVPDEDTVSARLSNWLDMDGSVFPGTFKEPVILGSMVAGNGWWKTSEACLGPQSGLYICPKRGDSTASVYFGYDAAQEALVGSNKNNCPNGSGTCVTKGTVTHFGRPLADGIKIAQNPKITGPILRNGGGWYVRFDAGTPRSLKIRYATVHPDDMLVIAVPYPTGTTFQVIATDANQCSNCQDTLLQVNTLDEVKQGFGDKYYFANGLLYFRIVQRNTIKNGAHVVWTKQTLDQVASFTREDITLMVMDQWSFQVEIRATNCGGSGLYCAIVPVNIPARTEPPVVVSTWAPTQPTLTPTKMPTTPCVPLWGNCHQSCCIGAGVICEYKDQWWSQCVPGTASPTAAAQTTSKPTSKAPTSKAPTRTPTAAPTLTKAPTAAPALSKAPSKLPTSQATHVPTAKPTLKPTRAPTSAPSQKPTSEPTRAPTVAPTKKLTKQPSAKPTRVPTLAPTKKPTKQPSTKPTRVPTQAPTKKPSKLPTVKPTKRPTAAPTPKPSKFPTVLPTKKLTKAPTAKPTKKAAA